MINKKTNIDPPMIDLAKDSKIVNAIKQDQPIHRGGDGVSIHRGAKLFQRRMER